MDANLSFDTDVPHRDAVYQRVVLGHRAPIFGLAITAWVVTAVVDGCAPGAGIDGIALTQASLADHVGEWGRSFVSVALLLFGFSTILYNYYLGENSLDFFSRGNRTLFNAFRLAIIGLCIWGAMTDLGTVFAFADTTMGFLALANLIALILLFKPGRRILRDFDDQIQAGVGQPIFEADKFSDLNVDPTAWEIEPEDRERVRRSQAASPTTP